MTCIADTSICNYIHQTKGSTYWVSSIDEFAWLTELDHALLEMRQWPLHQHPLFLVVCQQVVPQRLLKNVNPEISK